jgi:hypothetical protein
MMFTLFMGLEILLSRWLIKVDLFFSWTLDRHTKQLITLKFHGKKQSPTLWIQKSHILGRRWPLICYHLILVVLIWSCKWRHHSRAQQLAQLLALSCATMGRLHVISKFFHIILFKFYFPYFFLNSNFIPFMCLYIKKLEEEANMLTCNLSKTIHNIWFQQFGNMGTCLFAATFDDYMQAFRQFSLYYAFL